MSNYFFVFYFILCYHMYIYNNYINNMFDPSKMNLDLENLETNQKNKNINFKKEVSEKETLQENNNLIEKKDSFSNKSDVLSEVNIINVKENIKSENPKNTSIIKEKSLEKNKDKEEEKIIFDINISSIEYLIKYLVSKNYDFFILEPEEDKVKVSFRKDNLEKEVKYIKYPIYLHIILKAKALTKLKVEEITSTQEWKTEININNTVYKILSKTVSSNLWEKLFIKVKKTSKEEKTKN